MKDSIHPKFHPVIFLDTSCGAEFVTYSTLTSEETRDIKGVPHYVCRVEISSLSHPFYTGKQILVDTARRVEKFQEKIAQQTKAAATRKGKKVKRAKAQEKKTKQDKAEKVTEVAPVEAQ